MAIDLPFARHVTRDINVHKKKVRRQCLEAMTRALSTNAPDMTAAGGLLQVYCLDWDCNGRRLATGSNDQTVRVWKIDSRHRVSTSALQILDHPAMHGRQIQALLCSTLCELTYLPTKL